MDKALCTLSVPYRDERSWDRLEGCPLSGTSLLIPMLFVLIAPLATYVVVARGGCADRRGSALVQHGRRSGGGEMVGDGLRGVVPRYPGLKAQLILAVKLQ